MSGVDQLYGEFRDGLELRPGPADPTFAEVWMLHTDIVHLAGVRLFEPRFGGSAAGAEEVRLHLARFAQVQAIAKNAPLRVPAPAVRTLRALGRLLETTPYPDDLSAFFALAAPMASDFAGFATRMLGRQARPLLASLTVVARSGTLMTDQLTRLVPGFDERG